MLYIDVINQGPKLDSQNKSPKAVFSKKEESHDAILLNFPEKEESQLGLLFGVDKNLDEGNMTSV